MSDLRARTEEGADASPSVVPAATTGPPGGRARLAVALALAAALVAGGWWVWHAQPAGGTGEAGPYPVAVIGPDGVTVWNGTVQLGQDATALAALQEASRAGNFSVEYRPGPYVVAIGPYRETATLGWTFWIRHATGATSAAASDTDPQGFFCPNVGAAQWHLDPGDAVEWRWAVPGGTC